MKIIRKDLVNYNYQISAFSIAFLIFIALFGTSVCFSDRYEAVEEISTSNMFNQIIYSVIFLFVIYSIHNFRQSIFFFIKEE